MSIRLQDEFDTSAVPHVYVVSASGAIAWHGHPTGLEVGRVTRPTYPTRESSADEIAHTCLSHALRLAFPSLTAIMPPRPRAPLDFASAACPVLAPQGGARTCPPAGR